MTFRDLLNKVDEDKILNYLLEKEIATDMHFVQVEDLIYLHQIRHFVHRSPSDPIRPWLQVQGCS